MAPSGFPPNVQAKRRLDHGHDRRKRRTRDGLSEVLTVSHLILE